MKPIYVLSLIIIVAASAFFGYKVYHKIQLQSSVGGAADSGQSDSSGSKQEGEVPKNGDLCRGTGGIGQIVSIGDTTITLKRKDGKDLVTYLTSQTMIKISSGSANRSDLEVGQRVTLVGDTNPDGSFTADSVFVCN